VRCLRDRVAVRGTALVHVRQDLDARPRAAMLPTEFRQGRVIRGVGRMRWRIAFALAVLVLSNCPAVQASCDPPPSLDVVGIDESNERLFIRSDPGVAEDPKAASRRIAEARTYIEACKAGWGSDWSVSLFSSAERAGYKDDPALTTFVMDGSWAASYLAEYQNASALLVTFPLDPAQRKETRLPKGSE
jgi:hypothetical protein